MSEDFSFSASKINLENLAELSSVSKIADERRVCEISEIADSMAKAAAELHSEGISVYELLSLISEELQLSENSDKVALCRFLPDRFRKVGISLSEVDFLRQISRPETIVYMKNLLSDEAYDVFSQSFNSPRLRYVSGIRDAIKAVNDGEAGYCLLPLEERGGSRLSSVTELIFGNDLKINAVTPVFGQDGSADLKYALVSKCFTVHEIHPDDDRYLEIAISLDVAVDELLYAARSYNATPYRINTVVFYTEDGPKPSYSIVFKDDAKDFTPLLTYLTLYYDDFIPIGLYKNLE